MDYSCQYNINTNSIGDPAPYCHKDYEVEYNCGTSNSKYIKVDKEANLKNIELDCSGKDVRSDCSIRFVGGAHGRLEDSEKACLDGSQLASKENVTDGWKTVVYMHMLLVKCQMVLLLLLYKVQLVGLSLELILMVVVAIKVKFVLIPLIYQIVQLNL